MFLQIFLEEFLEEYLKNPGNSRGEIPRGRLRKNSGAVLSTVLLHTARDAEKSWINH